MLKEAVVFKGYTADSTKDGTSHEPVRVRAKSVYYVVVVPYVNLWNSSISGREGLLTVPANIVVEIVLVTILTHLLIKGKLPAFVRIRNICPWFEGTIDSDSVIVDLVASANHDMEWPVLMRAQNVVPKSRT